LCEVFFAEVAERVFDSLFAFAFGARHRKWFCFAIAVELCATLRTGEGVDARPFEFWIKWAVIASALGATECAALNGSGSGVSHRFPF
jgi:hypothetical protein